VNGAGVVEFVDKVVDLAVGGADYETCKDVKVRLPRRTERGSQ
jgi:hypothetical protein